MTPEEFKAKINRPFEEKLEETKEIIKLHAKDSYLPWSGGNLENVIWLIAREINSNMPIVFCDSGVEFPEVLDYIREMNIKLEMKNFHWITPEISFWKMPEDVEFFARGCCKFLIIDPTDRFMIEKYGLKKKFIGHCWQEGSKWKMLIKVGMEDTRFDSHRIFPLAWWNLSEIDEFLRKNNIPTSPMYNIYSRQFCWACPIILKETFKDSHPNLYKLRLEAEKKYMKLYENQEEKRKIYGEFNPPEWLK